MSIIQKLQRVQRALNAPKSQLNKFGGYKYRSVEDIQEAAKPLLEKEGCIIIIKDDIAEIAGRVYVKATAYFCDGESTAIETTAYAREALSRKGMDDSQVTGSASSYARKYALGGLLLIDDSKDADNRDNSDQGDLAEKINQCQSREDLMGVWQGMKPAERKQHKAIFEQRGKELQQ